LLEVELFEVVFDGAAGHVGLRGKEITMDVRRLMRNGRLPRPRPGLYGGRILQRVVD
jgi:hypothetical protein